MAFFDKLNDLAKNIGDKTSDAIETTKLSSRISSERGAAGEDLKKIGQVYYDRFAAGGEADPEVLELCRSAKTHYDAVAELQSEIDRIRTENEAGRAPGAPGGTAAPAGNRCPACGQVNAPGTRFCSACGGKLEPPAPPQQRACPACGAAVAAGTKFCSACGQRMEE